MVQFSHNAALAVYEGFFGFDSVSNGFSVEGKFFCLAALDAWIVFVFELLVENESRGGRRPKQSSQMPSQSFRTQSEINSQAPSVTSSSTVSQKTSSQD